MKNNKRDKKQMSFYIKGKAAKSFGESVKKNPYEPHNKWNAKKYWYYGWCEMGYGGMSDAEVIRIYSKPKQYNLKENKK